MAASNDYLKAYEAAKRELAEVVRSEEQLQKKKITLRKTIETLAALCESEGISVEPSPEATALLEQSKLADDVRAVLRAYYPTCLRPNQLMEHVSRIGRDLSAYSNPQSTIHMILKRMEESGEVEMMPDLEGKTAYRYIGILQYMSKSAPNTLTTARARSQRSVQADEQTKLGRHGK